ncbi:MAG: Notch-like protein, partial [Bradymonadia bacterium]
MRGIGGLRIGDMAACVICVLALGACDDALDPVVDASPMADLGSGGADGMPADAGPDAGLPGCVAGMCPAGQVCDPEEACVDRCSPGSCPPGSHCGAEGYCAAGACVDDSVCPPGSYCTGAGSCADGCRLDGCGGSQYCEPDRRVCVGCMPDEICGSPADEDCDGAIDEGCDCPEDAPCETGQSGACGMGTTICPPDGAQCVPVGLTEETCDGADNDCDDATDEGFANLGEACALGGGACAGDGIWVCAEDGAGVVCRGDAIMPQPETCNGADDDCDGETDEIFADLGEACAVGLGVCETNGERVCAPDGAGTVCDARPAPAGSEACNSADDDCDGTIDENFAELGAVCTLGIGACAADGVRVCLGENRTRCDAMAGPAGVEICDGADNDCDGRTDEGQDDDGIREACYEGPAGTENVGFCQAGARRCVDGAFGACLGQIVPVAEQCNGEDDDCDGTVDRGADGERLRVACYSGPGGSEGVGQCGGGEAECAFAGLGPCVGERGPGVEICDSVDNDCNGEVDDLDGDCACEPNANRDCYAGPDGTAGVGACVVGSQACAANGVGWGPCVGEVIPEPDVCNGIDDNCDGAVDDGVAGLGDLCIRGVGFCRSPGRIVCAEDGVDCDAEPGRPARELCNTVDDDCDGSTDEDFETGSACARGLGVCRRDGFVTCTPDGETGCNASPSGPAAETCNGIDDDCDGRPDEDYDVGGPCSEGVGACAADGVFVCTEDGEVACSQPARPPAPEICNRFDDDCDGRIDEGFGIGGGCVVGEGTCERRGLLVCTPAGQAACDILPGVAQGEQCNRADDDCDGETDEGLDNVGACNTGLFGICGPGRIGCDFGGQITCDRVEDPTPEACDALDNDCDGEIDEFIGVQGCGLGICARTLPRCSNGRPVVCDAFDGAQPDELCNTLDDDCDGIIDEGALGDGVPCFDGVGACRVDAVQRCEGGLLRCPAQAGVPVEEVCDAIDNDCDGTPDEGEGAELCGQGECLHAVNNCEGGVNEDCDPLRGAREETCNTLDDDCDGVVDEDAGDAGQACTRGVGQCQREGTLECVGGRLSCSAQPGPAVLDICDGLDNDCDRRADEAIPATICGRGLCRRPLPGCDEGAPPGCDPFEGAAVETCNSQDDDCDGEVDEGEADPGDLCRAGNGACQRQGQRVCQAGRIFCDAVAGAPDLESCDGLDNDCDLRVDERLGVGEVCQIGLGACRADGFRVCGDDGAVLCNAEGNQPVPEVCDGVDNDCDGRADEEIGDLGACDTGEFGLCRQGRAICAGGRPECVTEVQPVADVCDGLDNDCDSITDESLGTLDCGQGICRRFIAACTDGAPTACDPIAGAQPELCNQLDDDCDGRVDEDTDGAGDPCTRGLGVCERPGEFACLNGALQCEADAGAPQAELCNQLDDDCDGRTDEAAVELNQRCSAGEGVCREEGFLSCVDGAVVCEVEPGEGGDEVCDRRDNDCDGDIDEGFGVVLCGVGRCERAVNTCDGGAPMPCDPTVGAIPEECNGEDDDCDGAIDEDAANTNVRCSRGLGVCRSDGLTACVDGALGCDVEAGEPSPELCNGLDDDCNGITDNNPADTGGACVGGVGECAQAGETICSDGVLDCDAMGGQPQVEACDTLDNDCDGETDELGTQACGSGVCARRVPICVNGQPGVCDADQGAQAEVCDGIDDDCDGAVDEQLGQSPCGIGACARLEDDCQDGGAYECEPQAGARFESCDEVDNDCDGTTDEDVAGVGDACTRGLGACQREGALVCANSSVRCSVNAAPAEPEICNNFDDDCDGRIDEEAAVDPCSQGVGACRRDGFTTCVDGANTCELGAQDATPEECNGIDDDCDGRPDEGEPDCNNDLIEDSCDIQRGFSGDCNQNGVPDDCDINAEVSADCNVNGVPDECDGGCVADDDPPTVGISVQERVVNPGAAVRVTVDAVDNVGVTDCQLSVDGEQVELDAQCSAIVVLPNPGFVELFATATDAAGNFGFAVDTIRVLNPDDVEAPFAEITAPEANAQVREATPIIGTATDPNLTFWRTSWGPPARPDQNLIAEDTQPVVDGPLGVLDAGSIPLGDWVLRLHVEDLNRRS